ncbi:MAG: peptidoglycan-binding domain-containing protein [Actinomycetota bacterium]
MATVRGGITVKPHAQAFADECERATGVSSYGTYPNHQPAADRALDIFVPVADTGPGDAVAQFALDNWQRFGVRYVIWRQRIHWNDSHGWRFMEDRGSISQNHGDHNHVAFEPTGDATPMLTDPSAPQSPPFPGFLLRQGIHSTAVRMWQKRMSERGWRIGVDGAYGPESERVCRDFQADKGLVVDGIVGPQTWRATWESPIT